MSICHSHECDTVYRKSFPLYQGEDLNKDFEAVSSGRAKFQELCNQQFSVGEEGGACVPGEAPVADELDPHCSVCRSEIVVDKWMNPGWQEWEDHIKNDREHIHNRDSLSCPLWQVLVADGFPYLYDHSSHRWAPASQKVHMAVKRGVRGAEIKVMPSNGMFIRVEGNAALMQEIQDKSPEDDEGVLERERSKDLREKIDKNDRKPIRLTFNPKLFSNEEVEEVLEPLYEDKTEVTVEDMKKNWNLRDRWVIWEQVLTRDRTVAEAQREGELSSQQVAEMQMEAAKGVHNYKELYNKVASFDSVQGFWKYFAHLPQPSMLMPENKRLVRAMKGRERADSDQKEEKEVGKHYTQIGALMLFKDGIRPEWEDPANKDGGHFQFVMQSDKFRLMDPNSFRAATIELTGCDPDGPLPHGGRPAVMALNASGFGLMDEVWNYLIMGILGGEIAPQDFITGVRLVDKMRSPTRVGGRFSGHMRVEVWFKDISNKEAIAELKLTMERAMRRRIDGPFPDAKKPIYPGYKLDLRPHKESEINSYVKSCQAEWKSKRYEKKEKPKLSEDASKTAKPWREAEGRKASSSPAHRQRHPLLQGRLASESPPPGSTPLKEGILGDYPSPLPQPILSSPPPPRPNTPNNVRWKLKEGEEEKEREKKREEGRKKVWEEWLGEEHRKSEREEVKGGGKQKKSANGWGKAGDWKEWKNEEGGWEDWYAKKEAEGEWSNWRPWRDDWSQKKEGKGGKEE